jgi:peptidyl-Lys metalloendopeptidase
MYMKSTSEAKACYKRINDCVDQLMIDNRRIIQHNSLVKRCRSTSPKRNEAVAGPNERPLCRGADLAAAQTASAHAKKALDAAIAALASPNPAQGALMDKWFGLNNSRDATTVRDKYVQMRAFIGSATFVCPPKSEEVYAYVRPDKSFVIALSSLFFQAPETGSSSRPGVLVHEMSHFLLSGGTDDPAPEKYGTDAAQDLAKSDPNAAQRNAENYEYFVEELARK